MSVGVQAYRAVIRADVGMNECWCCGQVGVSGREKEGCPASYL